ncbi:MAG: dTDP-4-dehydrorhamnose 3,5-epimerase family protein [Desulfovibrionaceae bacterium]|nr:dTDP-4-dehydrorhamnose 3,5-epimerase family protein [Desulfovibrionaceae bacterium]
MDSLVEYTTQETSINGVKLQPLQVIDTPQGAVLHMLRGDYALMPTFPAGFGEIYFSEVHYGEIKAWKRHQLQQQLFAVPWGLLHLVLYDPREQSPTKGQVLSLSLGRPDHYNLLSIPCGIWYGFTAQSHPGALLCNCANIPHDPHESEHIPATSPLIPYSWA